MKSAHQFEDSPAVSLTKITASALLFSVSPQPKHSTALPDSSRNYRGYTPKKRIPGETRQTLSQLATGFSSEAPHKSKHRRECRILPFRSYGMRGPERRVGNWRADGKVRGL